MGKTEGNGQIKRKLQGISRNEKIQTNDVGDGLCHLLDILYDAFDITIWPHQYTVQQYGNMGGNHITGG